MREAESRGVDVDLEQVRHRFAEVRENLALLREAAEVKASVFASDRDLRDATMFRLLVAIEAAQAVCVHLAARLPVRAPDSMADCFECLADQDVVEGGLAARLVKMSRFRNLLVRRYWKVEPARVHDFLEEAAGDLEAYLAAVATFLDDDL